MPDDPKVDEFGCFHSLLSVLPDASHAVGLDTVVEFHLNASEDAEGRLQIFQNEADLD